MFVAAVVGGTLAQWDFDVVGVEPCVGMHESHSCCKAAWAVGACRKLKEG